MQWFGWKLKFNTLRMCTSECRRSTQPWLWPTFCGHFKSCWFSSVPFFSLACFLISNQILDIFFCKSCQLPRQNIPVALVLWHRWHLEIFSIIKNWLSFINSVIEIDAIFLIEANGGKQRKMIISVWLTWFYFKNYSLKSKFRARDKN